MIQPATYSTPMIRAERPEAERVNRTHFQFSNALRDPYKTAGLEADARSRVLGGNGYFPAAVLGAMGISRQAGSRLAK